MINLDISRPRLARLQHTVIGFALGCTVFGMAIPASEADEAARFEKARRKELRQEVKGFDKDKSRELSAAEREALRQAFATNPSLKPLDTNRDGKLDDAEMNAINLHKGGGRLKIGKLEGSGKLDHDK
jgi:hypothetical protein